MLDLYYYFEIAKSGLAFGFLIGVACFLTGFVISWLVGILKHF